MPCLFLSSGCTSSSLLHVLISWLSVKPYVRYNGALKSLQHSHLSISVLLLFLFRPPRPPRIIPVLFETDIARFPLQLLLIRGNRKHGLIFIKFALLRAGLFGHRLGQKALSSDVIQQSFPHFHKRVSCLKASLRRLLNRNSKGRALKL